MSNPERHPELAWKKINDRTVIIELYGKRLFHELNEVGSHVWSLCDGTKTVDDLYLSVEDHFDVEKETAKGDVEEFLGHLKNKNLIKWN